ncbi:transposase zinc-binding domain-containing protein, partial [Clostridium punense]
MIEVQDIFSQHGEKYLKTHNLPHHVRNVIHNIVECRTSQLGGHVEQCDECGHTRISYNSCRNRHCPKC